MSCSLTNGFEIVKIKMLHYEWKIGFEMEEWEVRMKRDREKREGKTCQVSVTRCLLNIDTEIDLDFKAGEENNNG